MRMLRQTCTPLSLLNVWMVTLGGRRGEGQHARCMVVNAGEEDLLHGGLAYAHIG
jgi:hypothetical protein